MQRLETTQTEINRVNMKLQASPASKLEPIGDPIGVGPNPEKPRVILGNSPDTLILFAWHTCYGQDTCDSVMSP